MSEPAPSSLEAHSYGMPLFNPVNMQLLYKDVTQTESQIE